MIKINYSKKIGIALCAFLSVGMFAQTTEEIREIRKANNLSGLERIKKELAKKPSVQELQTTAKRQGIPFRGEFEGKVFELKGFDKKTGLPQYYITNNAGAAASTGTDKLYASAGIFNLQGQNMTLHEWDGGAVRVSHQEFGGRVVQADNSASLSDHATHVAGTMVGAGVNAAAKGMAFQANLRAYDWTNDTAEVTEAAADGALVSNHSYGYIGAFEWGNWSGNTGWHWLGADEDTEYKLYGKYTTSDKQWDEIAANAPYYLLVKAAGNPRGGGPAPGGTHYVTVPQGNSYVWTTSNRVRQVNGGEFGFDSINHSALGKNILTVAAAHKTSSYDSQDIAITSFSGFGPVDDGRVKPDITGVGYGVTSAVTTNDAAYSAMNGTSMASPNVTGSLGLLQQHHNELYGSFMRASTLKALVLNTAKEAGNIGPDYKFGWGLLDAYKAAQTLSVKGKLSLVEEGTLDNGATQTIDLIADGSEPLKVTVVWTDPAPEEANLPDEDVLNDRRSVLVNDLDIKILKDRVETLPWVLDPANPNNPATTGVNNVDNVEQVVINNPEAGATYQLVISHKNTLLNNASQDFSFVATGIKQDLDYDLAINQVTPEAEPDNYSTLTPVYFSYENKGTKAISSAKINYKLINKDDNNTVEQQGSIDVANLQPGESARTAVELDLSKSFVNYEISGEVELAEDGISVNNKAIFNAYGILADLTEKGSRHLFGFEDDFSKNGWTSQDLDNDGRTWRKYDDPNLAKTGGSFAVNFPADNANTNDWMFSNPINLKAGTLYNVSFYARRFQEVNESITLHLGNQANSAAMTTTISPDAISPGLDYAKYNFEFTASADGIAYLGLHNTMAPGTTKSYAVAVDDFMIKTAEGKPVSDFSASKTNPNTFEEVTFTDASITASTQPITSYKWTFTPNTVTFAGGTSASSPNPKVIFNNEGTYSVALEATNVEGTDSITKTGLITAKNTATVANFSNSASKVYEGETVAFTNSSTGNPLPTTFEWSITPTEGFEFANNTNSTSKDPVVKFNKAGDYSVTLTATSQNNANTVTKNNLINVASMHGQVRDLKGKYNNETQKVELAWERPILNPVYEEDFEGAAIPAEMTVIDENQDQMNWMLTANPNSGLYGVLNYSWFFGAFDTQDWLVTPKLKAGAEVLEYAVRMLYKERYDIFIVEAPEDGSAVTPDMLKAGHKVFTEEAAGATNGFQIRSTNIKDYTDKDFYVAFLHRTTAADDGLALILDDIKVGYDNTIASSTSGKTVAKVSDELSNLKKDFVEGERIVAIEELKEKEQFTRPTTTSKEIISTLGVTNLPALTGYEITKNGVALATVSADNKTYEDADLATNGSIEYGLKAVYSDGEKSSEETVTVEIVGLSTTDVTAGKGLKIYPNPSDGLFVVENPQLKGDSTLQVFDMAGKLIENRTSRDTKTELDLRRYPKGVYILNVSSENGNRESVKLIIK